MFVLDVHVQERRVIRGFGHFHFGIIAGWSVLYETPVRANSQEFSVLMIL